MSFTIQATPNPARRFIRCDTCKRSSDASQFDSVLTEWKRTHVCTPVGKPLDRETAVRAR